MKIDRLIPGQTVWSVRSYTMGHTTMKSLGVYPVSIIEIDPEHRWVLASWNGNTPKKFYAREVGRWRKTKPETVTGALGRTRLMTAQEKRDKKEGKL